MAGIPEIQLFREEQWFVLTGGCAGAQNAASEAAAAKPLQREITLKRGDTIVAWKYAVHWGFYLLVVIRSRSRVILLVDASSLKVALFYEDKVTWRPGRILELFSITQNRVLVCGERSLFELVIYSPSLVSDMLIDRLWGDLDGLNESLPLKIAASSASLPKGEAKSDFAVGAVSGDLLSSADGKSGAVSEAKVHDQKFNTDIAQMDLSSLFPISAKVLAKTKNSLTPREFSSLIKILIDPSFSIHYPNPLPPSTIPLGLYPDFRAIVYPPTPCAKASNFAIRLVRGMAYRVRLGPLGRHFLFSPAYLPVEKYSSSLGMEPVLLPRGRVHSVLRADQALDGTVALVCSDRRGEAFHVVL